MSYKLTIPTFILHFFFSNAQIEPPKVYGELGYYRHTGFEDNSYAHARTGVELFTYEFISPEIDFTYYWATNEYNGGMDAEGIVSTYLTKKTSGNILGLSPKFFYGDKELRIVAIPKYHFGNVIAKALLSKLENPNSSKVIHIEDLVKEKISFWSFSLGIEGELYNDKVSIGGYLHYTGFDTSVAKIGFPEDGFAISNVDSKTIGISVRVLYSLWSKE